MSTIRTASLGMHQEHPLTELTLLGIVGIQRFLNLLQSVENRIETSAVWSAGCIAASKQLGYR